MLYKARQSPWRPSQSIVCEYSFDRPSKRLVNGVQHDNLQHDKDIESCISTLFIVLLIGIRNAISEQKAASVRQAEARSRRTGNAEGEYIKEESRVWIENSSKIIKTTQDCDTSWRVKSETSHQSQRLSGSSYTHQSVRGGIGWQIVSNLVREGLRFHHWAGVGGWW